jgi:hypothetical protein
MHTFDTTYYLAPGEAGLLGEHDLVRILGVPVRVTTNTGIRSNQRSTARAYTAAGLGSLAYAHAKAKRQQACMRRSTTPFPCNGHDDEESKEPKT